MAIKECKTNNETAHRLAAVLLQFANIRRVTVLGTYVIVDSFEKYDKIIQQVLLKAGLKDLKTSNGKHMDESEGYRITGKFKL